jgi:hypothetical protein
MASDWQPVQDVNVLKITSSRAETTKLDQLSWVEGKSKKISSLVSMTDHDCMKLQVA